MVFVFSFETIFSVKSQGDDILRSDQQINQINSIMGNFLSKLCCCIAAKGEEIETDQESIQDSIKKPRWVEKAKTIDDRIVLEVDTSFPQEEIASGREAILKEMRSQKIPQNL